MSKYWLPSRKDLNEVSTAVYDSFFANSHEQTSFNMEPMILYFKYLLKLVLVLLLAQELSRAMSIRGLKSK